VWVSWSACSHYARSYAAFYTANGVGLASERVVTMSSDCGVRDAEPNRMWGSSLSNDPQRREH